ncbi:hypothetical protein EYF80_004995 [Liparis tanakae]|uniref:Uncharacterized protein n=1 Tax=Liparis tanakae TaxID=230148 RepID=A0A4Z2J436_9TELE|nr:hypothetical protein EYF80_004995 [Liparis tanakae]
MAGEWDTFIIAKVGNYFNYSGGEGEREQSHRSQRSGGGGGEAVICKGVRVTRGRRRGGGEERGKEGWRGGKGSERRSSGCMKE